MLFKIGVLKNFCNFIKKRPQYRCLLVNTAKFLRTAFFIEQSKYRNSNIGVTWIKVASFCYSCYIGHSMAKKELFKTPNLDYTGKNNELDILFKKLEVEKQVETHMADVKRKLIEQRLSRMKHILEESAVDEWKYPKLEDLICF